MWNQICGKSRTLKRLQLRNPRAPIPCKRQFYKTKVCPYVLRGVICNRGTDCKFAHGMEELRPLPDLTKTRLCTQFVELGHCPKVETCPFAHSRDTLRTSHAVFHKVALCSFFTKGNCLNGGK
eukprot:Lankesteria_metandrocarpae@DN3919_c0_g1_i1.p5